MRIVADAGIPHLDEAFGCFGEVIAASPREITPALVEHADVLLVRSVRRVDAELLEASAVRFVGSPSIGTDHVDHDYLSTRGISFVNAPGCNADAVAQYVVNAVYHLAHTREQRWVDGPFGVVGYGNIGTRLTRLLRALRHEVLVADPPLAETGRSQEDFRSLDELVERCAVISLHVPRVLDGPHPTHHLLDQRTVACCHAKGTLVLNTSRGGVLDQRGIPRGIDGPGAFVLDTWEGEPKIDVELLDPRSTALATPHIAGYTREGKRRGTVVVHEALAAHLGRAPSFPALAPDDREHRVEAPTGAGRTQTLSTVMLATRDLRQTDASLRELRTRPADEHAGHFARLRDTYALQPQFENFLVTGAGPHADALRALGFRVA